MKTVKSVWSFCLTLACSVLLCTQLHAQTIISDTFTDADNTALANHAPDINLPGRPYQTNQVNGQPLDVISGNTATASASSSTLLFVAGNNNSPAAPTGNVTLSLDIRMGTIEGTDGTRGIFLGFFSTNGSINPDTNPSGYAGILINPNGSLNVRSLNSLTLIGTAPAAYSATSFVNLTYTLNLTTGIISSINFGGTSYTPPTTGIITQAPLAVGYYSASGAVGDLGNVDNLLFVNAVPEPSTWAMLLGGLGLLGGAQRLRRVLRA